MRERYGACLLVLLVDESGHLHDADLESTRGAGCADCGYGSGAWDNVVTRSVADFLVRVCRFKLWGVG